jgi:hypothetical protein
MCNPPFFDTTLLSDALDKNDNNYDDDGCEQVGCFEYFCTKRLQIVIYLFILVGVIINNANNGCT